MKTAQNKPQGAATWIPARKINGGYETRAGYWRPDYPPKQETAESKAFFGRPPADSQLDRQGNAGPKHGKENPNDGNYPKKY